MEGKDLQEVMNLVASKFVFNKEQYSTMNDTEPGAKSMFVIQHSTLHLMKLVGVLASVCERYDHAGHVCAEDQNESREAILKIFMNTLSMAKEAGFSAKGLLQSTERFFEVK